jgi:hypothetical protein
VQGPPPPWFFLALFPVLAASTAIVIRSVSKGVARIRAARQPAQLPPAPDPQVAQMQAELDELRTQVERLTAAQSFYAQLQPAAAPARAALPSEAGSAVS